MKRYAGLVLAVVVIIILALGVDAKEKRTKDERAQTAERLLCSFEFPFSITSLELTPNGYLHATALDAKSKKSTRSRYLLDESCNQFWKGAAGSSALLADNPYPVVMEVASNGLVLKAVDMNSTVRWTYPLPGVPASTISDPDTGVLVLVVMPYEWVVDQTKAYSAKIMAIDLSSGRQKWSSDVGNVKGRLDSFGGELGLSGSSVFWAADGRAFCANLSDGKIKWNQEIKETNRAGSLWRFLPGKAVMARGNVISMFSNETGLLWQQQLSGDLEPRGLDEAPAGVVASLASEKELIVTLLGSANGKPIWTKNLKHKTKKKGIPPAGLAVGSAKVAVFANDEIIGLDLSNGSEAYRKDVKSKKFLGIDEMRIGTNDFVLIGSTGVAAYSMNVGSLLWERMNFIDPIFETKKTQQAGMQLGMSSYAMLISSPGANKAWKEYRDGSRNYTSAAQEAAIQQQLFVQEMGERGKKMGAGIGELVEIDMQLTNRRLGQNEVEKYTSRSGGFALLKFVEDLDIVKVNLMNGSLNSIPLKKSKQGCVPQAMTDPVSRKVVQTYRQMGLLCKDENKIEIYGFAEGQ